MTSTSPCTGRGGVSVVQQQRPCGPPRPCPAWRLANTVTIDPGVWSSGTRLPAASTVTISGQSDWKLFDGALSMIDSGGSCGDEAGAAGAYLAVFGPAGALRACSSNRQSLKVAHFTPMSGLLGLWSNLVAGRRAASSRPGCAVPASRNSLAQGTLGSGHWVAPLRPKSQAIPACGRHLPRVTTGARDFGQIWSLGGALRLGRCLRRCQGITGTPRGCGTRYPRGTLCRYCW